MIYAENTTVTQTLTIPRTVALAGGETFGTLTIRSTVDRREVYELDVLVIVPCGMYHHIDIELPAGIPDGEYEYTLRQTDATLATGVMRIGNYDPVTEQSTGASLQFRQAK